MSRPQPFFPALLFLLSALGPAVADSEEYAPNRPYVIETSDGEVFSTRISGSDEDSLYFQDGSSLARSDVGSIRKKGHESKVAEEQTLHPGPETATRDGSTLEVERTPLVNFLTFVGELLQAIFGRD